MTFPDHIQVVGLTGAIGSGKSSVASFWQEHFSVYWLSADQAARKLLEPGQPGWQIIKELAGDFILSDKRIDRTGLRRTLFTDKVLRHNLNQALHPLIREDIYRQVNTLAAGQNVLSSFLIEVPLLYEVGWEKEFSEIVVVYVDNKQLYQRLIDRDKISSKEAEQALSCQWPLFVKVLLAGHVIDNCYSWTFTVLQLLHLGRLLWAKKT